MATPTLFTLASISPGIKVNAIIYVVLDGPGYQAGLLVSSPDVTGTQSGAAENLVVQGTQQNAASLNIRTNTSQQVQVAASLANATFYIQTQGWIDTRGRNN